MKFTRYFSKVLKEQGTPNINVDHYQRLLNIIVLENKIDLLYKLQKSNHSRRGERMYQHDISNLQSILDRLTMENKPENLLKYMLNASRFEN
ncbi:hypothetical protein [Winogradskyella forsetii]|uniref:hypothetical protein n=1 Tax=Winogradskyella forsetii TaxID=2686077 RepID=UPI0015BF29F8|nr:hypothetical protein [Winogradskyella forsetii]